MKERRIVRGQFLGAERLAGTLLFQGRLRGDVTAKKRPSNSPFPSAKLPLRVIVSVLPYQPFQS